MGASKSSLIMVNGPDGVGCRTITYDEVEGRLRGSPMSAHFWPSGSSRFVETILSSFRAHGDMHPQSPVRNDRDFRFPGKLGALK